MKYRKKPIIIEAYQTDVELDIETLEGIMHASIGDYIITGVNGERYPCKPDIFEKTYELVKENNCEMSKGLQTLKELDKQVFAVNNTEKYNEYLDIVKKELKAYEELEKRIGFDPTIFKQDFETLMKEHKALEIIKEKNVDVGLLKGLINGNPRTALEDYNDTTTEEELTIIEYELLKEVLL